jgi:hypothetical protein
MNFFYHGKTYATANENDVYDAMCPAWRLAIVHGNVRIKVLLEATILLAFEEDQEKLYILKVLVVCTPT